MMTVTESEYSHNFILPPLSFIMDLFEAQAGLCKTIVTEIRMFSDCARISVKDETRDIPYKGKIV